MSALPTELEHRVADVVLGALQKDAIKGYVVTSEGRQAIVSLFAGFTDPEQARGAGQEMVRCAHFVRNHLKSSSAAVDLLNTFALIELPRDQDRVRFSEQDSRRTAAKRFLAVAPTVEGSTDSDSDDGVPWWHVLK